MSLKSGDSYTGMVCTSDFTSGNAANASAISATANRNGVDDSAFALTVTNLDTGRYTVTGTIPSNYAAGDVVNISVTATVGSVTDKAVIDAFVLDSYRWADIIGDQIPNVTAGATGGLVIVVPSNTTSPPTISGTAAYATTSDFVKRWDTRSVGRLLSDTNTPLDPADVLTSTVLIELLKEASGEVELGCFKGQRYTVDDLVALVGTNAGKKLAGLVCDLTMWRLYDRRPDRDAKVPPRCEKAQETLDALAKGDLIFGLVATAAAGVMSHRTLTSADLIARNDKTEIQRRYMGRRAVDENDGRYAPP